MLYQVGLQAVSVVIACLSFAGIGLFAFIAVIVVSQIGNYNDNETFVCVILPALVSISLAIGLIVFCVNSQAIFYYQNVSNQNDALAMLQENPFDKKAIRNILDSNNAIEKAKLEDEDGIYADIEPIDYREFQKEWALDVLREYGIDNIDEKNATIEELEERVATLMRINNTIMASKSNNAKNVN